MSGTANRRVVVIGAGGHGKVVIATLQAAGYVIEALLDDDPSKVGQNLLGVCIAGRPDDLLRDSAAEVVLAIGDNASRQAFARRFPGASWLSVVHPFAHVHPSVCLGPGSVVFAGGVVQPDTVLGAHVIVNTGCTVDHDCVVKDFAHLAPGVHVSGGVTIGEGALLGIGCCVKPGVSIGAWATVGAGAAVVRDVPDGVVSVGVPARVRASRQ